MVPKGLVLDLVSDFNFEKHVWDELKTDFHSCHIYASASSASRRIEVGHLEVDFEKIARWNSHFFIKEGLDAITSENYTPLEHEKVFDIALDFLVEVGDMTVNERAACEASHAPLLNIDIAFLDCLRVFDKPASNGDG